MPPVGAIFAKADLVYLAGITLAILGNEGRDWLFAILQNNGSRIFFFDPNHRPSIWANATEAHRAHMRMAAVSEIVLASFDEELTPFAGEGPLVRPHRYADAGATVVLFKTGSTALALACEGQVLSLPLPRFTQPFDTIGASKSFNAAYLAARLQGALPAKANDFAHGIAANTVSRRGALVDPPARQD